MPHAPCSRSAETGTQNALATSSDGTISTSALTSATYGRITSGGSSGERGRRSSRWPRRRPSRATSMPVSSRVSRTAVTARSRSAGSMRPPGHAMCPLHGSPSNSARLIMSSSGSPFSRERSTSRIAARRVGPSGSIARPGCSASVREKRAMSGCAASRSSSILFMGPGAAPRRRSRPCGPARGAIPAMAPRIRASR